MSDAFERLTAELGGMDVTPRAQVKAHILAVAAKKIEEKFQENPELARPTCKPPQRGQKSNRQGWIGHMTRKLKKTLFLGTSGLVTAGIAAVFLMPTGATMETSPRPATGISNVRSDVTAKPESHRGGGSGFGTASNMILEESPSSFSKMKQSVLHAVTPAPDRQSTVKMTAPTPMMATRQADMVQQVDRDRFPEVEASGIKQVAVEPVSTFSIDVDTAGYSSLRSYLERGQLPDADAVRIEEMINYFPYDYAAPEAGSVPFSVDAVNFATPWNAGTELVRIGIQGTMPEVDARPPLDIVFLIDTSGSMRSADKLGLLKQSLKMMLPQMHEGDRIGIVTYAGSAGVKLEMTDAADMTRISAALDDLQAGGSTAGAAGLKAAYGLLEPSDDRIGRVILATDGDFNVGLSSVDEMKAFIEKKRDTGAYLSVLGFGQGNYNDALMQTLAQNGNGQAAYIDTISEAQKVLVDQLSGTLFTIAGDVKVQLEFNPAVVSDYRLIGYETRALNKEDFRNDKVDAGDIGAGHQVTALYEITPVGSSSELYEPSRYGAEDASAQKDMQGELGYLRLRYKAPGEKSSQLIEVPISTEQETMEGDDAFVSAVAGWGQFLKGGRYLGDWSMEDAATLARQGIDEDPFGYRAEALRLMRVTGSLSR